MVRRHINHLWRWVVISVVVIVLAAAGLLSAGRGLLLSLPYFIPQLEQLISDPANFEIQIGALEGRWIQLSPRLEATGVVVKLASGGRIEIGRMELQFDPLRSIRQREVVFNQILLDQLDLSLFRSKQGWRLAVSGEQQGLSQSRAHNLFLLPDSDFADTDTQKSADSEASEPGSLLPLIDALLLHDELELRNANIQVQFAQHSPLPPQQVNLKLQNVGEHHALTGQLKLAGEQAIEVRSVLNRLPKQPGFSAEFYLKVPDIDQRFWSQLLPRDRPLPQQFVLGGELWGSWRADGRHSLQGAVRMPQLRWQAQSTAPTEVLGESKPLLQVDDLALQLQLQLDGPGQGELGITDLQGQVDGVELPFQRLSARKRDNQWLASAEQIALQPLWQWINGSGWVPEGLKQRLDGLDPVGQLSHARLQIVADAASPQPRFEFSADLQQVGVSAWRGAPALQGVNGLLQVNDRGGRVDFTSDRLGLDFPKLYSQGWQFNQARGVVDWQVEPRKIRVQSQRLQLAGDNIKANGRFSLELPLKPLPVKPKPVPVDDSAATASADINAEQAGAGQVSVSRPEPASTQISPEDQHGTAAVSEETGRLILMIGIEQADATLAARFVPDKVLPSGLFSWLDQSIRGGHLNVGGLIIDLPLTSAQAKSKQPLKYQSAVQMFFDVEDAMLKYQPQWPQLSQADPYVLYKDGELLIDMDQGRVLQSDVGQSQVYLSAGSPQLQVNLLLDGPAADIRTALIEGPTGKVLAEGLSPWRLAGSSRSRLQLGIDLKQPKRSLIRIESDLNQTALSNPSLRLELDHIEGRLRYHERDGLSAESLKGRLFDQSLNASISTRQFPEGPRTQIEASGRVEVARLNRWLQQPLLNNLQGTTDYRARLEICSLAQQCSNLRVDSLLQGVSVALPAPYGKSAGQHQPLTVDISLESQPWMRLRYAQQLDLLLPLAASPSGASRSFNGGELVLGRNQQAASKQPRGLSIRGQLDRADAQLWFGFIRDNFFTEPAGGPVLSIDSGGGSRAAAGSAVAEPTIERAVEPSVDATLQQLDIEIDNFMLGDLNVEQLQASLLPQPDGWLLALQSPMVRGDVLLPQAPGEVHIELDYLRLPGAPEQQSLQASTAKPSDATVEPFDPRQDPLFDIDPRTVPAARVSIDAFSYGDRELGRWQLQLQPQDDGLRIADLNANMGSVELLADIDWHYQKATANAEAIHNSEMELVFKTGDLEQAMQAWGTSMGLETESALLSGQFNWRGSPLAFNWQTLDGEAQLQAENGRMLDTGGGAQVVKLFSLFNSQTIWRRLSLDFSDLAKDGISFDLISGHYRLSDGVVNSSSPLVVTGPTIDLQLEGSLDLVNETINQQMLVVLPISENLPVAAVFLASPAIAGAVFLVEKLIGDKLSKFTSVRYRIDGDLNAPQINLLQQEQPEQSITTEH